MEPWDRDLARLTRLPKRSAETRLSFAISTMRAQPRSSRNRRVPCKIVYNQTAVGGTFAAVRFVLCDAQKDTGGPFANRPSSDPAIQKRPIGDTLPSDPQRLPRAEQCREDGGSGGAQPPSQPRARRARASRRRERFLLPRVSPLNIEHFSKHASKCSSSSPFGRRPFGHCQWPHGACRQHHVGLTRFGGRFRYAAFLFTECISSNSIGLL